MTFYYYIAQGIKRGLGFRMLNYFRRVVILLKIYLRASPNVVLFRLLEKLRPHVATRIKKFYRRRVSLCAYVLYLQNSYNQACRFLYKAAVARKGVGIVLQLFLECVLCLQGRSAALQMRKETHAKAFEILRINRRFQKNKQPGTQIFQLPKSFWLSPTSNR